MCHDVCVRMSLYRRHRDDASEKTRALRQPEREGQRNDIHSFQYFCVYTCTAAPTHVHTLLVSICSSHHILVLSRFQMRARVSLTYNFVIDCHACSTECRIFSSVDARQHRRILATHGTHHPSKHHSDEKNTHRFESYVHPSPPSLSLLLVGGAPST